MSTLSLDDKFMVAANNIKNLKKRPSDNELLSIYGLYKQSTIGDNTDPRPSFLDPKGQIKWDAWNKHKGVKQKVAKLTYIDYVHKLSVKYGVNE